MTLCVGWIRKVHDTEELCLAADSCFSGKQRFYAAPKIFPLSRGDCAIACAGCTTYSFPVIEHILRAIELNGPVNDRADDFLVIINKIEDIINKCLFEEKEEQLDEVEGPDFSMIIAGYSWRTKSFRMFILKYNKKEKKMRASKTNRMAVIGDHIKSFKSEVYQSMIKKGLQATDPFDFQPLEVLIDFINDKSIDIIAGHPQMVKIYSFMKVLPLGFYSAKKEEIYYFGRTLLNYETFPYPIYDMDTKQIKYMKTTVDEFKRSHEETKPLGEIFKTI